MARGKKTRDFLATGFAFIILFPMMYLMLATVVFLLLAMLPTLVSLIVDSSSKDRLKYKWMSIGGLNFAGSLPFLFRLWFGNNTWDGAVGLFLSGGNFIIIYATAFIGWLFYRFIPSIVLSFLEMTDQRRVVSLREAQEKLVARWGEEVTASAAPVVKKAPEAEKKNLKSS